MLKSSAAVAALLAALAAVPSAQAEFPLAAGKTPTELNGGDWKLAATPESPITLLAAFRRVVSAASETTRPFQIVCTRSSLLTTRWLFWIK